MDGLSARFFFTPRGWLVAYIHDTRHTDFCNAKTHTDRSGLPECNRFYHRPRPVQSRRWVYRSPTFACSLSSNGKQICLPFSSTHLWYLSKTFTLL